MYSCYLRFEIRPFAILANTALFATTDAEIIFSLLATVCNFERQSQETKGIVVVHVYSCIKEFDTSDITELLKQYEVWEAHAKEYLVACKEKLLQLQVTCYTEQAAEEDDIELWSAIVPLTLINYIFSFFCVSTAYLILYSEKILLKVKTKHKSKGSTIKDWYKIRYKEI